MDDPVTPPMVGLDTRVLYEDGWLRLRVDTVSQRGATAPYGVVERSNSVVIVPVAPNHEILLLRQFRYPTGEYAWELPMGTMEAGEAPDDCARRELIEETGLMATAVREVGRFRPIPSLTTQAAIVFEATVPRMPDVRMAPPDADEIVGWRVISTPELRTMLCDGEISDGLTLSSLALFFARH